MSLEFPAHVIDNLTSINYYQHGDNISVISSLTKPYDAALKSATDSSNENPNLLDASYDHYNRTTSENNHSIDVHHPLVESLTFASSNNDNASYLSSFLVSESSVVQDWLDASTNFTLNGSTTNINGSIVNDDGSEEWSDQQVIASTITAVILAIIIIITVVGK